MEVKLTRKQFEDFRQTLESMHLQGLQLPRYSSGGQMATSNGVTHYISFERTPKNNKLAKTTLAYAGIKLK